MRARWMAAALLALVVGSGTAVWRADQNARGRPAPDPRYDQMNELEVLRSERRDLELFAPRREAAARAALALEGYDAGL